MQINELNILTFWSGKNQIGTKNKSKIHKNTITMPIKIILKPTIHNHNNNYTKWLETKD